jgi:hypothetical protein
MKTKVLLMFGIILISGCTNQTPKPMTDKEKAEIIEAVTKTAHALGEADNQVNFLKFKDFFVESPDYITVTSGGSILNYNQYMKREKDFFESVSTLHVTNINENIIVLERTSAVYTTEMKIEAISKTGEKLIFDNLVFGEIYKKIDGKWKIIFLQESWQPPVATGS